MGPRLARRATTVLSTLLVGVLARAAERTDAIAFEAPSECGGAAAFANHVGGHTGQATTISKDAPVRVRITRIAKGFRGTLTVVDESGPHERAVDGHTCAEVIEALALVTAMALEEADAAHDTEPPAPSVSASAPPAASSAPVASSAPPPSVPAPPSPPPLQASPSRWAIGAGFEAVAFDGSPPPLGASLHAEWSLRSTNLVAPSVRIEVARLGAERTPFPGSTVSLSWTHAELDVCPLRPAIGATRFDACVLARGGTLAVSSAGLSDASAPKRPWLGAGALARARVDLFAGLHVEAKVALIVPITRDRLLIEPGIEAYRPAPLTLGAGVGVGWYFP